MFSALLTPAAGAPAGAHPASRPLLTQPLAPQLNGLINRAISSCVASPRHCATIAGVTAAIGATALVKTLLSALPEPATTPPTSLSAAQQDRLLEVVPQLAASADGTSLEDELLVIAAQCNGELACRAERINALLERLPATSLARLQQWVEATAPPMTSSSWPPGADAAPLLAQDTDALSWLAHILAGLYTPEVATLLDDLEAIVGNPQVDPDQPPLAQLQAANTQRIQQVEALLQRDGTAVQRQYYELSGAAEPIQGTGPLPAYNLLAHVVSPAQGPAPRRLLLVAHADMIGIGLGSQGAFDNASGVSTMLHIARQLRDQIDETGNTGVAVDVLVTSNEEIGLEGARGYVKQCQQHQVCPTLVLNIDLAGRGGHGYIIASTAAHQGRPDQGHQPYFMQSPTQRDTERSAESQLQTAFANRGFIQHQAHPGFRLASDQMVFQNASIDALGLAQMSAGDAAAMQDRDDALRAWWSASLEVDWPLWHEVQTGNASLTAEQTALSQIQFLQLADAYDAVMAARNGHPQASIHLIHNARDRLERVNPRMAVDFGDAVVDFIHQWSRPPVTTTSSSTQGVGND